MTNQLKTKAKESKNTKQTTSTRVQISMNDLLKTKETDQAQTKSETVNPLSAMSNTIDSLDNCSESIKQLDKKLDDTVSNSSSVQELVQEIVFDSKGEIDDLGVDLITDYATRLKNLTEGKSEHNNFKKLDVLRGQFFRAFEWAEKNEFIKKHERLSLVGTGKKMTQSPDTESPYAEVSASDQATLDQAQADAEKSQERQAKQDFEDAFVSLKDGDFNALVKKRNEFKLMTNDTAVKTTIVEVKK